MIPCSLQEALVHKFSAGGTFASNFQIFILVNQERKKKKKLGGSRTASTNVEEANAHSLKEHI